VLLVACSSVEPPAREGVSVRASTTASPTEQCIHREGSSRPAQEAYPKPLRLPTGSEITAETTRLGTYSLDAHTRGSVTNVYVYFRRAVSNAGFTVLFEENETREAEIFFLVRGQHGAIRISKSRCFGDRTPFAISVQELEPTGQE
jgi:hypothetical protein